MSYAPPPPPRNPYRQNQPLNPSDERLWATLVHIGGIFFSFVPALIGYLVLKDRGPFIRQHTTAALNFQLTMLIAHIVGWITTFILIGIVIIAAVGLVTLVFSIIAAVRAHQGAAYAYPIALRFVR